MTDETLRVERSPGPDGESLEEIFAEYMDRLNAGEAIDSEEVRARHPGMAASILERLREFEELGLPGASRSGSPASARKFGGYRIVRELGRGGMGVVYEAVEESMDRRVALKVLPPGLVIDRRSVERFRGEARIAAKLRHPNIVTVYATGLEDGTPYIAMEFVEGETLARVLERKRPPAPTPSPAGVGERLLTSIRKAFVSTETDVVAADKARPAEAGAESADPAATPIPSSPADLDLTYSIRMARAFADVADGLAHAHSKGITHRDIKPSNLILERDGTIRVLDFGLARLEGEQGLTGTGEIVGTPRYMSPEQARARETTVDHRTDIYSLGATLYEVLTLTPPFEGKTAEQVISEILHRDPAPPRRRNPRIPPQLETVVLKCLRKDPQDRYGTAEAFAHDLRSFARGDPIEARPESLGERISRRVRRNRGRAVAAVLVLVLLGAATAIFLKSREASRGLVEARYFERTAEAAGKLQIGIFANQWGSFAWQGLGYDPERLGGGLETLDAVQETVAEVRRTLEEEARNVPERPEAHFHLARLQRFTGDREGAAASLRRADDAGFAVAGALLAQLLEEKKDFLEASRIRTRIGASGEEPHSLWLAASKASEEKRWKDAVVLYRKLIDLEKSGREVYPRSGAEVYVSCGLAHLQLGENTEALECFQRGGALRRGAIEPELFEGYASHRAGEPHRAEEIFEQLYRRTGSDEVAQWVAQIYWVSFFDWERALLWAERMGPGWFREFWRTSCLARLGRGAEAIESAARLRDLNPDAALSWFLSAAVALSGGDHSGAAEMARKALEKAPRSAAPREILAGALSRLGRMDEARGLLQEAIDLEPGKASAHFYLGLTLWSLRRMDEARGALEKSIEFGSEPTAASSFSIEEACLRLGQLEESAGNPDAALDAYRRGVERARSLGFARADLSLALAALQRARGLRSEAIRTLDDALVLASEEERSAIEEKLAAYCRELAPELPTYLSIDLAIADLTREDLIPPGAEWAFRRGSSPASPGIEWTRPGFDDSTWERGASGFGYGDGDDRTELADMRNGYTTLYVRRRFSLPAGRAKRLVLSVACDDGFIAYLNGGEVGRLRAGDEAAPENGATARGPAPEPLEPVEIEIPAGAVLPGENVVAILGLNSDLGSSDFSLIPVLRREREPDPEASRRLAAEAGKKPGGRIDQARQSYLRGRVHQILGEHEAAVSELEVARLRDPAREEICAALAESLIALGKEGAARDLWRSQIAGACPGTRRAWSSWLRLSLSDPSMSAREMLNALPCRGAARPRGSPPGAAWDRAHDIRWLLDTIERQEPIRIRCGGGDLETGGGRRWGRDRFFVSGQPRAAAGASEPLDIAGTEDDALYLSGRWFPAGTRGLYEVPLPPGDYAVELHFAEAERDPASAAVFDVIIEGTPVLVAYTPAAAGFATADVRRHECRVADGILEIEIQGLRGSPRISAIEIRKKP